MDGTRWSPAKDSRSIITKQYETVRFLEEEGTVCSMEHPGFPKRAKKYSGIIAFYESPGNQVVMSLSDGMGSEETAARRATGGELTEQLLETDFPQGPPLSW